MLSRSIPPIANHGTSPPARPRSARSRARRRGPPLGRRLPDRPDAELVGAGPQGRVELPGACVDSPISLGPTSSRTSATAVSSCPTWTPSAPASSARSGRSLSQNSARARRRARKRARRAAVRRRRRPCRAAGPCRPRRAGPGRAPARPRPRRRGRAELAAGAHARRRAFAQRAGWAAAGSPIAPPGRLTCRGWRGTSAAGRRTADSACRLRREQRQVEERRARVPGRRDQQVLELALHPRVLQRDRVRPLEVARADLRRQRPVTGCEVAVLGQVERHARAVRRAQRADLAQLVERLGERGSVPIVTLSSPGTERRRVPEVVRVVGVAVRLQPRAGANALVLLVDAGDLAQEVERSGRQARARRRGSSRRLAPWRAGRPS